MLVCFSIPSLAQSNWSNLSSDCTEGDSFVVSGQQECQKSGENSVSMSTIEITVSAEVDDCSRWACDFLASAFLGGTDNLVGYAFGDMPAQSLICSYSIEIDDEGNTTQNSQGGNNCNNPFMWADGNVS